MAQAIVDWAGHELGDLACGVIRQLGMEQEEVEVVLVGSLYNGSPRLVRLQAPPVVGSVLLRREQAGMNGQALRQTLIESARQLLRAEA